MPLARDLSVSDLRLGICDHLKRVEMRDTRFRLMRHGRPLAALVTVADLLAIEAVEAQSQDARWERLAYQGQRQDWLAQALEKARRGEDVTWAR